MKNKFFEGVPKLKRLIDAVANKAEATGMSGVSALRGIDGRRIRIRHMHAALNSLLQSCGAVACKYWLIAIMRQVQAEGLDCTPVGNIHKFHCGFLEESKSKNLVNSVEPYGAIPSEALVY